MRALVLITLLLISRPPCSIDTLSRERFLPGESRYTGGLSDGPNASGVHWKSFLYVDKVLPFGLRSVPKVFSTVVDTLQWVLHYKGIQLGLHYLDYFILVASYQQTAEF